MTDHKRAKKPPRHVIDGDGDWWRQTIPGVDHWHDVRSLDAGMKCTPPDCAAWTLEGIKDQYYSVTLADFPPGKLRTGVT